jgi:MATE family multidrug resistance protein
MILAMDSSSLAAAPFAAPAETPSRAGEARTMLRITLPIAAGFLAEMAMHLTDTIIIGQHVGSVAFSAVSVSGNILWSVLFLAMAVVSIVGTLAAQAHGAGDRRAISHVVRQGFWIATALSIPATIIGWNMAPLLRIFGQEEEIVVIANGYMQALVWSFLPYMWFTVLRNFVTALARTVSIMAITVSAIALNLAVVYTLVTGAFGMPAMGPRGAAIGTTLVNWAMFAALAFHVTRAEPFRGYRVFAELARIDWSVCVRIFRIGIPAAGTYAVESGLFVIVQLLMGTISIAALSANQVAYTFGGLIFMIPAAISQAAAARVGFWLGAGNPRAVRQAGFIAFLLCIPYMAATSLFMWLFPEAIVNLFLDPGNEDIAAVMSLAVTLLAIGAVFQVVDGTQYVALGALRGINDTKGPFWLGLLGYWGIGLGSGYVLAFPLDRGPAGLWVGMALGLTVTAALLTWRFHHRTQAMLAREQR